MLQPERTSTADRLLGQNGQTVVHGGRQLPSTAEGPHRRRVRLHVFVHRRQRNHRQQGQHLYNLEMTGLVPGVRLASARRSVCRLRHVLLRSLNQSRGHVLNESNSALVLQRTKFGDDESLLRFMSGNDLSVKIWTDLGGEGDVYTLTCPSRDGRLLYERYSNHELLTCYEHIC